MSAGQTTLVLFFVVLYMKSKSSQAIQHAAVSSVKASGNISYKQRREELNIRVRKVLEQKKKIVSQKAIEKH